VQSSWTSLLFALRCAGHWFESVRLCGSLFDSSCRPTDEHAVRIFVVCGSGGQYELRRWADRPAAGFRWHVAPSHASRQTLLHSRPQLCPRSPRWTRRHRRRRRQRAFTACGLPSFYAGFFQPQYSPNSTCCLTSRHDTLSSPCILAQEKSSQRARQARLARHVFSGVATAWTGVDMPS